MKKKLSILILVLCLLLGAAVNVFATETQSEPSSVSDSAEEPTTATQEESSSEEQSSAETETTTQQEVLPLVLSLLLSDGTATPAATLAVGEEDSITVHLYADGATLRDTTFSLRFGKENFSFVSAEYITHDGKVLTNAQAQTDGSVLLTCMVAENAALQGTVEIAKLQFKTTAATAETAHTFALFSAENEAIGTPVSVTVTHRHSFGNWQTVSTSQDGKTKTQSGTCIHCRKTSTREIPVRDYTLKIKEGNTKIKWDAETKTFYALPDDLTVQDLLAQLQTEGDKIMLNKDGSPAEATARVKTGMVVCVLGVDDIEPTEEYRATVSVWGDANGDGEISVNDARFALRYCVGLETTTDPAVLHAMECNKDGEVALADARIILRTSVGLDFFYPIPTTGITLNKTGITLYTDNSETLRATVTPDNASYNSPSWSSSDSKVATVSNGKVIARKAGTAVITATTHEGQKAQCTVTVVQAVNSVTAKQNSFYLPAGKKIDISKVYTASPENAVKTPIEWKSSNPAFTVENGVISCTTAYDNLSNKITDISLTFPGGFTHKFRVTLIPANATYCQFTYDKLTLAKGTEFWLSAVTSKDVTVKITSSNASVLQVDNTAKRIKAVGVGTAKLTCTGVNYTTTCTVTVTSNSVKLNTFTPLTDTQDLVVNLTNNSGQKITRMDIYLQGLNTSGKVIADETRICRIENLPKDAKNRPYNWNRNSIWKNSAVADAQIEKIILTFEDGHMETIKGEYVTYG